MDFWIKNRCHNCSHTYRFKATSNLEDASDVPDKDCPKCKAAQRTRGMDISAGRAPAVGGSNTVKAMDMAANLVMEDHGMTDLSSDGREGAIMAPKLPPGQQQRADAMFSSARMGGSAIGSRVQSMVRAAQQGKALGAFAQAPDPRAPNPVEMVHRARQKPPVTLLNPRRPDGSLVS